MRIRWEWRGMETVRKEMGVVLYLCGKFVREVAVVNVHVLLSSISVSVT